MKKLLYVLRHYSFVGLLILPFSFAQAAKYQVIKSDGTAFSVTKRGKTNSLRAGEYIYYGDEILVEENSHVSLLGPNDLFVHLNGGTHLQFEFEGYKLIKGSVWLQQKTKKNGEQLLETSNSLVKVYQGDVIVEYSDYKEKTNIFVLNGSAEVSNLFDRFKNVSLSGGEFTFVHKEHDEGRPRLATLIGKESFVDLRGHFANVTPLEKSGVIEMYSPKESGSTEGLGQLNREIASLDSDKVSDITLPEKIHENHGGTILITTDMKRKWYLEKNPLPPKKKKIVYPKRPIVVYGSGKIQESEKSESIPSEYSRVPASVVNNQSEEFAETVAPRFNAPVDKLEKSFETISPANNPADSFLEQLRKIEESETEVY